MNAQIISWEEGEQPPCPLHFSISSECKVEDKVISTFDLADTQKSTQISKAEDPGFLTPEGQSSPRLFTPRLLYEKEIRFSLA